MSVILHRAVRTDRLADQLAGLLARPLADPFATEVIGVPTPGVERWLAQFLSHRLGTSGPERADGVAAGFAFWSVARLVGRAVAHLVDPETDPWRPEQLCWTVLAELDAAAGQDWAAPVSSYLGLGGGVDQDYRQGRRWATARRLAGLFHRYGVQRPELITHWLAGRDTDATDQPLSADRAWQAELWRRVRRRIGAPSGAERIEGACAALRANPDAIDLPERISVFGVTRLTREHLRVLGAVADHRDVHLWLPHPSPALWQRIAALSDPGAGPARWDDPSAGLSHHPLLGYLSRDSRELQRCLQRYVPDTVDATPDAGVDVPLVPPTLLGRLQAGLTADRPLESVVLGRDDHSLSVHAAHGPDRQVEVLRDVLVGLLADDPTLEPRDIVVMCPDIERFAPLVAAAFGLARPDGADPDDQLGADHPGHRLRVRLADRSLRQVNPLLGLVSRLVDLAQSRVTATEVLDLCATEAVMRKFAVTDDDLDLLADLVRRSGVRWGVDADHREAYGLAGFPHNTWRTGLDRMLLGVAMEGADGHYIGTALPLDDVDSGAVERIGRLAELIDRLSATLDALTGRHPVQHWLGVLTDALDALAAVPSTDQWQLAHAYASLVGLAGTDPGATAPSDEPRSQVLLGLADVRALLADTVRGRPTRANFRTGSLTMCTMMPMRSVPHRVVCLLGVDDGVFPRRSAEDGDDLTLADPWVGDRDPRSEDRQLLLDAVLAAQERLVIVYSGADPRTNAVRPPAAPIGALLDAVDDTVHTTDGRRAREAVTVRHLLQPFDPGNFVDDAAGGTRSFDRAALSGARALVGIRHEPVSPWLVDVLPALDEDALVEVSLTELMAFFRHPVRAFLRSRAGLYLRSADDPAADEIPIELDGLQAWAVGDRLLARRRAGASPEDARQAEWRAGLVPPRRLGHSTITRASARVDQLLASAEPLIGEPRRTVDIDLVLPHGRLTGAVSLHGSALAVVQFGRPRPKRQLDAWIQLLAASAARPTDELTAYVLGPSGQVALGPVPGEDARVLLDDLLAVRREGLREPLAFAANTSAALVEGLDAGLAPASLTKAVADVWRDDWDATYGRFFARDAAELKQPRPVPGGDPRPATFRPVAVRVLEPMIKARR